MRNPDGHPLLAATLDLAMAPLQRLRPRTVQAARGAVLELGVGTGANFAHYTDVDSVVGIEPDPHMLRRAQIRADAAGVPITLHQAGAEALPFADHSFDSAVVTWVMCTIPEPERAAAELWRVLRPGGTVHFVEHVQSPWGPMAGLQQLLNPLWCRLAGGCHLNRDPEPLLHAAGFAIEEARWHGPQWGAFPLRSGQAHKPQ